MTRVALERQIARLAKSPKLMSTNGVVRKSIAKSINSREKCTKSWALVKIETRVEPVCALLIMAQLTVALSLPDILLSYLKTRTIIFAVTSEKTTFHDSGVSPLCCSFRVPPNGSQNVRHHLRQVADYISRLPRGFNPCVSR